MTAGLGEEAEGEKGLYSGVFEQGTGRLNLDGGWLKGQSKLQAARSLLREVPGLGLTKGTQTLQRSSWRPGDGQVLSLSSALP